MTSSRGTKEDDKLHERELLSLAMEIKIQIETIDKKVQDFRTVHDSEEIRPAIEDALASEIDELYIDQEALKKTFCDLAEKHFVFSGEGEDGNITLKPETSAQTELVWILKKKFLRLRDEGDHYKVKFNVICAETRGSNRNNESTESIETNTTDSTIPPTGFELFSLSRFIRSGDVGLYFRNYEAYTDWSPRLLSKKLKIVRFYYLKQSIEDEPEEEEDQPSTTTIDSRLQRKFGWLRKGKNLEEEYSELEATGVDDTKQTIMAMVRERRRDKAEAREHGKRSLMEYVIADRDTGEFTTLNLLRRKTRAVCESLSLHAGRLFYVVSEAGLANYKFQHHLWDLLRWLNEKGKTPVIRRFAAVLRKVEDELRRRGKTEVYSQLGEVLAAVNPKRQKLMDRALDSFLREIVRVESVVSYPNLSGEFMSMTIVELKTFERTLKESEKMAQELGKDMEYLRVIHRFVSDNAVVETAKMASFDQWLAGMVAGVWEKLCEGYKAS